MPSCCWAAARLISGRSSAVLLFFLNVPGYGCGEQPWQTMYYETIQFRSNSAQKLHTLAASTGHVLPSMHHMRHQLGILWVLRTGPFLTRTRVPWRQILHACQVSCKRIGEARRRIRGMWRGWKGRVRDRCPYQNPTGLRWLRATYMVSAIRGTFLGSLL